MYPFFWDNDMIPYFEGVRSVAANVPQPGEKGDYTLAMFQSTFPQFFTAEGAPVIPENVLDMFIANANSSVLPSRWGEVWELAAGLYVAHFVSLYAMTYAPNSATPGEAAQGSAAVGPVKAAKMGDSSVEYDTTAITQGTATWGAWNSTIYGQQFTTLARPLGMLGMYVI